MGVCSSLSVFIPLSVFTRIDPIFICVPLSNLHSFANIADSDEVTRYNSEDPDETAHDEPSHLNPTLFAI